MKNLTIKQKVFVYSFLISFTFISIMERKLISHQLFGYEGQFSGNSYSADFGDFLGTMFFHIICALIIALLSYAVSSILINKPTN